MGDLTHQAKVALEGAGEEMQTRDGTAIVLALSAIAYEVAALRHALTTTPHIKHHPTEGTPTP